MNKEAFRRKSQLEFVASDQDLTVGEEALLPMSLEALQNTNQSSEYVMESYDAGLTGVVYHICIAGKHYNLKLKRKESLVQNTDGQTSFLNVVQRRRDFQLLKTIQILRKIWSRCFNYLCFIPKRSSYLIE